MDEQTNIQEPTQPVTQQTEQKMNMSQIVEEKILEVMPKPDDILPQNDMQILNKTSQEYVIGKLNSIKNHDLEDDNAKEKLPRKISLPGIEEPDQSNLTENFEIKV